ncbi:hypothetical protein [Haloplanus sp. C73]|uniref:hypothetical protein n=1 Tax=Haloplanus sp. C73 TaxID=3421641 RepID=UPI003EB9A34A
MVLSRRALLRGAGVALAGSLAGCGMPDTPSQLGALDVVNPDTQSYTVHVLLFEGESLVYWASKRVPAATDDELGTATFDGYPEGIEPTRLLARLEGGSLSTAARFDFTAHDADCLGLQLEVDEEATPTDLLVWYTTDPEACETATPEG